MSRKVIPESMEVICDICGDYVGKEQNVIELSGNSLDRGVAVGPAYMSGTYDCCDECYAKVVKLIRNISS